MGYVIALRLLAVAAGMLLVAAACGGDDGGASPSPSPGVLTPQTSTPGGPTLPPTPTFAAAPACTLGEPGPVPTMFPAVSPLGGGSELTPPTYREARLIVPGVSIKRSLSPEEEERLLNAVEAVPVEPPSEGGEVNCVRLFARSKEYDAYRTVCGGDKLGEFRDFEGFAFEYLPPQTYAHGPQVVAICPDGSVSGFGRDFSSCCGSFQAWFSAGKRGLQVGTGARIYAASLGGRPAVILLGGQYGPLRRDWIAMATENGSIIIDAGGMPLDEAVNIAVAIRCEMC